MKQRLPDNQKNTDKAIDRLGDFLLREMETPSLAAQIPDGAHLFHGAFDETALTQHSLELAGDVLLGMLLGYVEDAPLLMLYEYQPRREKLIDLSSDAHRQSALGVIRSFREANLLTVPDTIEQPIPA